MSNETQTKKKPDVKPLDPTKYDTFEWGKCDADGCPLASTGQIGGGPQLCLFHLGVQATHWRLISYKLRRMEAIVRVAFIWTNTLFEDEQLLLAEEFNRYVDLHNAEERKREAEYLARKAEIPEEDRPCFLPLYIDHVATEKGASYAEKDPIEALSRAFNAIVNLKKQEDVRMGESFDATANIGVRMELLNKVNELRTKMNMQTVSVRAAKRPVQTDEEMPF